MAKSPYPLQEVITVKENRVRQQEKVVAEKRQALEKEQEKLRKAEEEYYKVQRHYDDKLAQMRHKLDTETNTGEIQQMKVYLKVVVERLKVEKKKVKDQQGQVDLAQKNLEIALSLLKQRRQDVDKFMEHRKDWMKEWRKVQELEEAKEQDEMGSITYVGRHFGRH